MIKFGYYEYINIYYDSLILIIDELSQFVEDDIFPFTLGCDPELNYLVLIQLALLMCELLFYVVIMPIYEHIVIYYNPILLLLD